MDPIVPHPTLASLYSASSLTQYTGYTINGTKLTLNRCDVDWIALKADPRIVHITEIRGSSEISSFSLPPDIQLPNLEKINLSNCLDLNSFSLPVDIQLPALKELNFTLCASISSFSLPENINLPALNKIDLTYCMSLPFFSLPERVRLPALEEISLANNTRLTSVSLPENIDLPALKKLNFLGSSSLTSLSFPRGIQLPALETLNIKYCSNLTSLPESITTLPQSATVEIEGTGLSPRVIQNLQALSEAPGYSGPQFSFSMAHTATNRGDTLEKCIKLLNSNPGEGIPKLNLETMEALNEKIGRNHLRVWLNRTHDIFEAKSAKAQRIALYGAISQMLYLASEDSENGKMMLGRLQADIPGAITSCGDRMALSVIYLDLFRQSLVFNKSDLKGYAEFLLRGQWRVELLEQIARETVKGIRGFFDEIEVYLAFLILLKQDLKLPICLNNMLFLSCAGIRDIPATMEIARHRVLELTDSIEAQVNYLLNQSDFMLALRKHGDSSIQKAFEELEDGDIAKYESNKKRLFGSIIEQILDPTLDSIPAEFPSRISSATLSRRRSPA